MKREERAYQSELLSETMSRSFRVSAHSFWGYVTQKPEAVARDARLSLECADLSLVCGEGNLQRPRPGVQRFRGRARKGGHDFPDGCLKRALQGEKLTRHRL